MASMTILPIHVWALPIALLSRNSLKQKTASLSFNRHLTAGVSRSAKQSSAKLNRNSSRGLIVAGADLGTERATDASSLELMKAKGNVYFAVDTRPIILFDGVCNLCNGAVNFLLDNDAEGRVRFAALQSDAGRALLVRSGRAPEDISSVVLVDKDTAYIKSEAVLQTAKNLGFPFPPLAMAAYIVPLFLRDILYDQVADNRYSIFGQTTACRMSDNRFEERFISS